MQAQLKKGKSKGETRADSWKEKHYETLTTTERESSSLSVQGWEQPNSCRKKRTLSPKVREQRRVLLHSLKDLHLEYKMLTERPFKLSYRPFLRYCPFYVTPAKESDRNTCACIDHENVKLLVDKSFAKRLLVTASISDLLSFVSCDTRKKSCTCANCCYNEIQFIGPLEEGVLTWQQWSRINTSQDGKTY